MKNKMETTPLEPIALEMTSSDLELLVTIINSYIEISKRLGVPSDMLRDVGERAEAIKACVDMRKTICNNLE